MEMKYKFATILCLILLMTSVFAATTIQTPILKPTYTSDRNYTNWPLDMNALAVGGTDLNSASVCWYMVSTGGGKFLGTWSIDSNKCKLVGYTSMGTNDFNFSMIVQNGVGDTNYTSPTAYYWLDDTAPVTVGTSNGLGTLVLTSTDAATTTGNGSGVKQIWYKLDSAVWTSTATNPLTTLPE